MTVLFFLILFTIVFLIFSAFFSASETALFSIPRERILFFQGDKRRSHQWVYLLLLDGQRTLLLILLGNIFVNITLAGLVHSVVSRLLPDESPLLTLVTATAIIVLFGEMLPKNIALKNNESVALGIAPFLFHLKIIVMPILRVIQRVNLFFLVRFKERLRRPSPFITVEELKTGVIESARNGAVSSEEKDILLEILREGAQPVRKLMTHRSRVVVISEETTVAEGIRKLYEAKQGYAIVRSKNDSRQITGSVKLNNLLKAQGGSVAQYVISPVWVPETMEVADLISYLFNEGYSEVCVLDEFGAFSGVFSLSSGLNRILANAFPLPEKENPTEERLSMVFAGLQDLETMDQWLPSSLKTYGKEVRTLNGLITNYLGKIPKAGDRFAIDGWIFYIITASPTKIESVLIRKGDGYDR